MTKQREEHKVDKHASTSSLIMCLPHGSPLLLLCPWVFNEKTVKAAQDFEDASVMDECGTSMPLFGAVFFDLNVGGRGAM